MNPMHGRSPCIKADGNFPHLGPIEAAPVDHDDAFRGLEALKQPTAVTQVCLNGPGGDIFMSGPSEIVPL